MGSDAAPTRITVSLLPRTEGDLDALSTVTGESKTDLVNRAVQLLAFIHATQTAGGQLLVRMSDGSAERVHLL